MRKALLTLVLVVVVSVATQIITALPWWSFVIPEFILGVILPFQKWKVSAFFLGFIGGFISWFGAMIFFSMNFEGEVINPVSEMLEVSSALVFLIIGLLGGLLNGLAVYSGYLLRKGREVLELKIP